MLKKGRWKYLNNRNIMKVVLFFLIFVPGTIPAIIFGLVAVILFAIDPQGILLQQFIVDFNNYLQSELKRDVEVAIIVVVISLFVFILGLNFYDYIIKRRNEPVELI